MIGTVLRCRRSRRRRNGCSTTRRITTRDIGRVAHQRHEGTAIDGTGYAILALRRSPRRSAARRSDFSPVCLHRSTCADTHAQRIPPLALGSVAINVSNDACVGRRHRRSIGQRRAGRCTLGSRDGRSRRTARHTAAAQNGTRRCDHGRTATARRKAPKVKDARRHGGRRRLGRGSAGRRRLGVQVGVPVRR